MSRRKNHTFIDEGALEARVCVFVAHIIAFVGESRRLGEF